MNVWSLKDNYFCTGRAATAIYLILKAENMQGKKVLFPANICYAAIYPAIYAGCEPVFCDIDQVDGNVTYEGVCEYIGQVAAMVIPHMYGNPVQDIEKIQQLCNRNKVLFIEDCASAMGASVNSGRCGSFGDYSIFSTGYSKTIDIGNGGFLLTNQSIAKIQRYYEDLPVWNKEIEENESFFSKLYRLIRNNDKQTLDKYIWKGIQDNLKDMFLYQYPKIDEQIQRAVAQLDATIGLRRKKQELYENQIIETEFIRKYTFYDGAVPWRFCLLVSEEKKRMLIDKLLERKVPVSDWYPVVTPIFGAENPYGNAYRMEKKIINFPLLIDDKEIQRICNIINHLDL